MERRLLLLGLLRSETMHGYQLNEFIDSHLGSTVQLKKPTAYRLLNQMAGDGWVTYREEREGNRPPRRVFSITPEGEAAFQKRLRESLSSYEPTVFHDNISMLFLDAIPPTEALELLWVRRASVERAMQQVQGHDDVHGEASSVLLLHQTRHLEAELGWLDEVIARLQADSAGQAASSHESGGFPNHSQVGAHSHPGHGAEA